MAEKTLKFQFQLDSTSFNQVKRQLDELVQKSQVLAKTLGGAMGGGSGLLGKGQVGGGASMSHLQTSAAAPQSFSKVVLQQADAFKNLGNVGAGAMKGLTDALKRAVSEQSRQVDQLQEKLNRLGDAYAGGGTGGGKSVNHKQLLRLKSRLDAAIAEKNELLEALPESMKASVGISAAGSVPPAGKPRLGPLSPVGNGNFSLQNPMQGLQQMLGSTGLGAVMMRSAGLVGAGALGVVNQSQGWNNAMGNSLAARGDVVNPMMNRVRGGDMSDVLKAKYLSSMAMEDRTEMMRRADSLEARGLAALGGAADTVKGAVTGKGLTGATDMDLGTANAERYQQMLDAAGHQTGYAQGLGRGYDYINETRGGRLSASRILGAGFNRKIRAPGFATGRPDDWKDSYTPFARNVARAGLDEGEYLSAYAGARGTGGSAYAGQFAGRIAGAGAAGFDISGLLGGAARGAGLRGALGLAQGAMGGGIATGAGIQLGSSLFGFDPRGTVSGAGALKAAQAGFGFTGGPEDFNSVQRIQMGMAAGDGLSRGFDGYQQGRNTITAINSMPGASSYAQDSLAGKTSFKELLELASGGSSARSRAYGITAEGAQSQLGGMASGVFSRFVDQGGGDQVSKTIRAMRASGQSSTDFLSGLGKQKGGKEQLEALGVYMADEMGIDTEGGIGAVGMLSGVKGLGSRELKAGNLPFGSMDEIEKRQRERSIEQQAESAKQMIANMDKFTEAFSESGAFAKTLKAFGEGGSIDNLRGAIEVLTQTLREKNMGSTTAAAFSWLDTGSSYTGTPRGAGQTAPKTGQRR